MRNHLTQETHLSFNQQLTETDIIKRVIILHCQVDDEDGGDFPSPRVKHGKPLQRNKETDQSYIFTQSGWFSNLEIGLFALIEMTNISTALQCTALHRTAVLLHLYYFFITPHHGRVLHIRSVLQIIVCLFDRDMTIILSHYLSNSFLSSSYLIPFFY